MSVTSRQILEATGLKSAKTLTRWAKLGVIPGPHIGTHPSGRGKIAYWPDYVLERCERIAGLVRQGHTLGSACSILEHERILHLIDEVEKSPDHLGQLLSMKVKLPDGQEINVDSFIYAFIAKSMDSIILDAPRRKAFVEQMRDSRVAAKALQFIQDGYNPICLYDGGERIEVIPDFLVSHRLREEEASESGWLVVPILQPARKALSALGRVLPIGPLARAAPKIWARQGDTIVEYPIYLGGRLGFELIRELANTIGRVESSDDW
jgi:hypothetical protein